MTWSERMKATWITFKRVALPLYAWTFIFIGAVVVLIIAMVLGVLRQLRWTIPLLNNGSFSSGMPVPGVPPRDFAPFTAPFGSQGTDPFSYFGGIDNLPMILSSVVSVLGTLGLIMIVGCLIGTAFYVGLFNLTAKGYREKVTFKDFRFEGFFRFLGWQGIVFLINLLLFIVGIIGIFALRDFQGAVIAFLIVYGLFLGIGSLYILPWITSSSIYLLAHRDEGFRNALSGSWQFFRRHMGSLWGYIGTVILIQIALQVLTRISSGLAGIATLVVSPFITVLAIVWVLSLEDDELNQSGNFRVSHTYGYPTSNGKTSLDSQAPIITPPSSSSMDVSAPSSKHVAEVSSLEIKDAQLLNETKISLDKSQPTELLPNIPTDAPQYCPTCGKANAGTKYCPLCGTKL